MQRVPDYIDQHLDEDLGLATLSKVAAFSKHHFHREFSATFPRFLGDDTARVIPSDRKPL
jgi:AraC-like DNA-binding protein